MSSARGHVGFPVLSRDGNCRAFSLVEVVLALGLFTFCLVPLLALLPLGLTTAKSSREETAASSLVEQISEGIRDAATNSSGAYVGAGVSTNLSWSIGGSPLQTNYVCTLGGVASTNNAGVNARIQLTPPADGASAGTALVSVAWPQQAKWVQSTSTWSNARGSVEAWVTFLPRQ